MAISFPRTSVLTFCAFVPEGYNFRLQHRQEQSRTAGGMTFVKDLGEPLWLLDATTQPMPHDMALEYEAILESLEGGLNTFTAWDLRRPYPKGHADGDFADTATVSTVGSNSKSLALSGLPAGFEISRGDYVSIENRIHQFMESGTANASGELSLREVRPHLMPSASTGMAAKLKRPSCRMTLIPGSLVKTQVNALMTSVSFKGMEAF